MAGVTFDVAAIEAAARRLATAGDDIERELEALSTRSAVLASRWSGEAREAYLDAHHAWQAQTRGMRQVLAEIAAVAARSGERYDRTESAVARAWRLGQ